MSLLLFPQLGPSIPGHATHPDSLLCPAVALFSLVGFTQMTIWAKGKHRSYLKEFRDYPPLRMPIIPFLL